MIEQENSREIYGNFMNPLRPTETTKNRITRLASSARVRVCMLEGIHTNIKIRTIEMPWMVDTICNILYEQT